MGKPGAKHKGRETPSSLREMAGILESVATELRAVAERMDRKRVKGLEVMHSRGVRPASRKLRAFALDADRRAAEAGA